MEGNEREVCEKRMDGRGRKVGFEWLRGSLEGPVGRNQRLSRERVLLETFWKLLVSLWGRVSYQ